jgi:hypothetical protein
MSQMAAYFLAFRASKSAGLLLEGLGTVGNVSGGNGLRRSSSSLLVNQEGSGRED